MKLNENYEILGFNFEYRPKKCEVIVLLYEV